MTASSGVVGAHAEARQLIGRVEVERMKRIFALITGSVHRVLAAAHLEAGRETGFVGKTFGPVHAERIAIAMSDKVCETRNSVVPFAVVRLGIADRSGKVTATEDGAGEVDSTGIRDGLEV